MESTWDQIAENFATECRGGHPPDLDAFLADQNDPDGELRPLLESIAMIEGLKKVGSHLHPKPEPLVVSSIKKLDDYRIVRELGRGGMGVVFEAVHESLGRRVAIKVLSTRDLDDERQLKRFQQEAQAAARLTHSNIVPVYGVGHDEGHHYYVMDLIQGMTVRQWIDDLSGRIHSETPTIDASADTSAKERAINNCPIDISRPAPRSGNSRERSRERANKFASYLTSVPNTPLDDTRFSHTATGNLEHSATSRKPSAGPRSDLKVKPGTTAHFRLVASRVADICDGLDYAHRQGTLHRDIKPANLLLDHEGAIWITDFGLAKLAESDGYTRTGDIVGTPQYMPPESFEGQYDQRSEVYAVGLTLYEMLAGRTAIAASTQAEAIREAMSGVSIPLEKRVTAIPRDLATITMKALSTEPLRRYGSAGAMRDDLRRYLADRPISAKRSRWSDRLIRWSRREPLAASLTAAVFASLLALAVVSFVGFVRTRALLTATKESNDKANAALEARTEALMTAQQQRSRATKNLDVAIAAFDELMTNVIQRGVDLETEAFGDIGESTSPDVSAADAEMLQSLLGFFDELAENNEEDFQIQSAAAFRRVGDIFQRLGQLKSADEAYSKAIERMNAAAKLDSPRADSHPNDTFIDDAIWRAEVLNEQANIAGLRAQVPRAVELFQRTIELLVVDGTLLPSDEAQFQYARANSLFASIISRAGIELPAQATLANLFRRNSFREFAPQMKQTQQQVQAISESIDVLRDLCERNPDETRYQVSLARAFRDQAKIVSRRRQNSLARESIGTSIDLFRNLQDEFPESESIRYEYSKTLCCAEALTITPMLRLGQAIRMSESLLRSHPEMARYRELKATVLGRMAEVQSGRGNITAAMSHCQDELALRKELIEDYPDRIAYQTSQCQTLGMLAELQTRSGDRQAATISLEMAIALAESIAKSDSVSAHAQRLFKRLTEKRAKLNPPGAP